MTLSFRWPAVLQAVMQGQPRALADSTIRSGIPRR